MSDTPATIVATYQKGNTMRQITWNPGEEMPYAIEAIEEFLGPGQVEVIS